jgi:DNA-binding XRE family transcriptional regulator
LGWPGCCGTIKSGFKYNSFRGGAPEHRGGSGPIEHSRRLCRIPHIQGSSLDIDIFTSYIRQVESLTSIGERIAGRRKALGLSQAALARQARVGHSTLDALENGRLGELGLSKILRILSALGLELKIQETTAHRPTLEELMKEDRDDQGVDRRR